MDIGLYNAKYGYRKVLKGAIVLFEKTDPNLLSWSIVPVGIATAAAYFFAEKIPWLYFAGVILIILRMTLGTLDGLVAVTFSRSTAKGELINRIAPELCDIILMLSIALSVPARAFPGMLAVAAGWLVTFSGLLGLTVGKPTQSVGPVGQTDRIAALIISSILQFLSLLNGWMIDFIYIFLWWTFAGGLLTSFIRIKRNFGG